MLQIRKMVSEVKEEEEEAGEKVWIVAEERNDLRRWAKIGRAALAAGVLGALLSWALVCTSPTRKGTVVVKTPGINLGRKRWGIAGLGRIAYDFAVSLKANGGHLEAVAAGSLPNPGSRASDFGCRFGARHYGTYEALAADPKVDVVYVATTNQLHMDVALVFVRAGKAVLVEKPTGLDAPQALAMLREARAHGVLLATNFWNMLFPVTRWAIDVVKSNKLGEVLAARGDMGFEAVDNLHDRFLSPELGGGAMLDMGCYIVHLFVQLAAINFERKGDVARLPTRPREAYEFSRAKLRDHFEAPLRNASRPLASLDGLARVRATGHLDRRNDDPVDVEASAAVELAGTRLLLGTSLQRASPFTFDVLAAHGTLSLDSPANCPTSASAAVYRDANDARNNNTAPTPCCGQPRLADLRFASPIPSYPESLKPERYPRGMGFGYVQTAVEACLSTPNCLELPEIPAWTQLATQQIVDAIIREIHQTNDAF
ncbi:hypothetical protein CTAYLR_003299 [Chrysophaeum taylorii]|uniref:D-xylose 1-dehydrogenase (NADP(+), D-xylono-1,5-lactone-forming) n=1 Tax=Chrysophaeum taylorii TaxID=2483200 RepID=A0AAD7UIY5_9STRA|nr:hypothetical protein CTAYLR_003299 [Chrysophaeum taylorii]